MAKVVEESAWRTVTYYDAEEEQPSEEDAAQAAAEAEKAAQAKKKQKRRTRRRLFLLLLVLLWWTQNYLLSVHSQEIASKKLKNPMTVVLLSDLHASALNISDKRILNAVSDASPDLICVVGDMYTKSDSGKSQEMATDFLRALAKLGAPVYFVPGEHDRSLIYLQTLRDCGIHVMNYTQETISVKGNRVTLYGIDNAYFSPTFDLKHEFEAPAATDFSILLAHIPNYDAYAAFGADLTLCGDTHGGVMQLPFYGPINYKGEWLPELTRDPKEIKDKGLFTYPGGNLFITSGLGNYPAIPARLANPPEIAVLKLQPAK